MKITIVMESRAYFWGLSTFIVMNPFNFQNYPGDRHNYYAILERRSMNLNNCFRVT